MSCQRCVSPSIFSFELPNDNAQTLQNRQIAFIQIHRNLSINLSLMYQKSVLRHINSKRVTDYLTPKQARVQLGYPELCLPESQDEVSEQSMVGLGVYKETRSRMNVIIVNKSLEIIYKSASQQRQQDSDRDIKWAGKERQRVKIQQLIKGNILVGYNMGRILNILKIAHDKFIDLAHLFPEIYARKQSLRRIAFEMLGIVISQDGKYQYANKDDKQQGLEFDSGDDQGRGGRRRVYDRRRDKRMPSLVVSTETANACLRVVQKCIEQGRGVLTTVSSEEKQLTNIDQLLRQAEIDINMVRGLFLRGSRALGIDLETQGYKSDWDYACVIDTPATINSVLLKLHNVDFLLFDTKSFYIYANGGDLPMIELFYLPSQCMIINKLTPPIISVPNCKNSLIYHLVRSDQKLSYLCTVFYSSTAPKRQYSGDRKVRRGGRYRQKNELTAMQKSRMATDADPQYVKWKFIKVMHMQLRFVDLYLQIKMHTRIINPLSQNQLWKKLQHTCQTQGHYKAYLLCRQEINKLFSEAFTINQLQNHKFNLWKRTQQIGSRRHGRRQYGYRGNIWNYRNHRERRNGGQAPHGIRSDEEEEVCKLLSIYRNNRPTSTWSQPIYKVEDVQGNQQQFKVHHSKKDHSNSRHPIRIIVNTSSLKDKKWTNSHLLTLLLENTDVADSQFKNIFKSFFLKPATFFKIRYIHKCNNLPEDTLASLINFIPLENANMEQQMTAEVSACILRSHLTEMQVKTTVKTLVCYMYTPFLEYYNIKGNQKAVATFEEQQYQIFQKYDGVLTALYYSGNGWIVATRDTPDARQTISAQDQTTISAEFLRVFNELGYRIPSFEDKLKVFLFELLSTRMQNTISKSKDKIILHGVRDMSNLQQQKPQNYALHYGWKCAQRLNLSTKSFTSITQIVNSHQECEGFIVKFNDFKRIVFRNKHILKKKWQKKLQYILSQGQNRFNSNDLIDKNRKLYFIYSQIVLKNKHKQYVDVFPESRPIISSILEYIQQVNRQCKQLKAIIKDEDWQGQKVEQLIADKRIDVLTYLKSYCHKQHPQIFEGRMHTAIKFNQTFVYLLQHLHYRNIEIK